MMKSKKKYILDAASLTNTSGAGVSAPGVYAVYDTQTNILRVYDSGYDPATQQPFDTAPLRASLGLPAMFNGMGMGDVVQPFSWNGSTFLPMSAVFPSVGDTVSFIGTKDELFSIGQKGFDTLAATKFSSGVKIDKIILTDATGLDSANLGRIFVTADQARLLAAGTVKIANQNVVVQDTAANMDQFYKDISVASATLGAKLTAAGVSSIYVDPTTFVAGQTTTYSAASLAAMATKGITTTLQINSAIDLKTMIQKDPALGGYTSGLKVDLGAGLVDPANGVLVDAVEGQNSLTQMSSWITTFSGTKLNVDAGVFLKMTSSYAYQNAGPEIEQLHAKAGVEVTISASVETLLALSTPNPTYNGQSIANATIDMSTFADKLVIYTNGGDSLLNQDQVWDNATNAWDAAGTVIRPDLLNDNQVYDQQTMQLVTGDGALNKIENTLGGGDAAAGKAAVAQFVEIKSTTGTTELPVKAALELANAGFKFSAGDNVSATVQSVDLAKADSLAVYSYSVDRYDSMQLFSDGAGHTYVGRSDVSLDAAHNNAPTIQSYNSQTGSYDTVYIAGDITWSTKFNATLDSTVTPGVGHTSAAPDVSPWNQDNTDNGGYPAAYDSNWKPLVAAGNQTLSTATTVVNGDNNADGWTAGNESTMLFAQQQWNYNYNTYNYDFTANALTTNWNVATQYTYTYDNWNFDYNTWQWVSTPTTYTYAYPTQATVAQNLTDVTSQDYGQGRIWKFDSSIGSVELNAATFYLDANNDGINNDGVWTDTNTNGVVDPGEISNGGTWTDAGAMNGTFDAGEATTVVDLGVVRAMGATYDGSALHVKIASDVVDGSGHTGYYRTDITAAATDANGNGIADAVENYFDQNTYSYVYQGKDGRVDSTSDYNLLQAAQNQGYYFDFNNNGINDSWEGLSYSAASPIYDINGDGTKDVPDANNDNKIDPALFNTVTLADMQSLAKAGLDSIVVSGQQLLFPLSDSSISPDPNDPSYIAAEAAASDLLSTLAYSSLKFLTQDGNTATLVFSDVRANLNSLQYSNNSATAIESIAINVAEATRLAARGIKIAGADGNGILRIVDTAANISALASDGALATAQALRDIGVVDMDVTDGSRVTLGLDQAKAMGLAGLHFNGDAAGNDYVVVKDELTKISTLTAAQIAALGALGVDKINAVAAGVDAQTLTIDVNKMRALVESGIVVDATDTLKMNIDGKYLLNQSAQDLAMIADVIAQTGLDLVNPINATGGAAQLELTAAGFKAFKDFIIGSSSSGVYGVAAFNGGKSLSGIKVITTNSADLTLIGSATERASYTGLGLVISPKTTADIDVAPALKITEGVTSALSLENFFKFHTKPAQVGGKDVLLSLADITSTGIANVMVDLPQGSGLSIMHATVDGLQPAETVSDGQGGFNVTLALDDLAAGNYFLQHDGSAGEGAFNNLRVITGTQQVEYLRLSDATSSISGSNWFSDGKSYTLTVIDGQGATHTATHTFSGAFDDYSGAAAMQAAFSAQLATLMPGELTVQTDYDRLKFTWKALGAQLNNGASKISLVQNVDNSAGADGEDLVYDTSSYKKPGTSSKGSIKIIQGDGTTLRVGDKFNISLAETGNATPTTLAFELTAATGTGYTGVMNAINAAFKGTTLGQTMFSTTDKTALGYATTDTASTIATLVKDAALNVVGVQIALGTTNATSTYAKALTDVVVHQSVETGSTDIEAAKIVGIGGVFTQDSTLTGGSTTLTGSNPTGDFIAYTALDNAPTITASATPATLLGVQGKPAIYLDGLTVADPDGQSSMDEISVTLSALRGAYDGKFKTVTLDSWVHVYKDGATTESVGADRYNLNANSLTLTLKKSDLVTFDPATGAVIAAKVDFNHDGVVDSADTTFALNSGMTAALNAALSSVSFELGKVLNSNFSQNNSVPSISFDVTRSDKVGLTTVSANSLTTVLFAQPDAGADGLVTAADYTHSGLTDAAALGNALGGDIVLKLAAPVTIDSLETADLLASGSTVVGKLTAEVDATAWTAAGQSVLSLINAGVDRVNFNDATAAAVSLADLNATKKLVDIALLGNMSVTGVAGTTAAATKESFVLPWSVNLTQDTLDGDAAGSLMVKDVLDQTTLQITNFDVAATGDTLSLSKFSGLTPTLVKGTYNTVDTSTFDFTASAGAGIADTKAALGISAVGIFAVAVAGNYDGGGTNNDTAITFIQVTGQDTNGDGAINALTGDVTKGGQAGVYDTFSGQQAGTVELLGVNLASITSSSLIFTTA